MSDIFKLLKSIDNNTVEYDESVEKEFNPYMVMKWMSSTKDPKRILLINQLMNSSVFLLSKEKRLLFNLTRAISDGNEKRYQWLKRPKKLPEEITKVVSSYYDISHNEAIASIPYLSKSEIFDMATDMGYTNKELKSLKTKLNATELS
jgi:hypothetical protein